MSEETTARMGKRTIYISKAEGRTAQESRGQSQATQQKARCVSAYEDEQDFRYQLKSLGFSKQQIDVIIRRMVRASVIAAHTAAKKLKKS
jgi:hypothetical protein